MQTTLAPSSLFQQHEAAILKAVSAIHDRRFYAHFPEAPSKNIYGENAATDGIQAFQQQLANPFVLRQDHDHLADTDEQSPYTQKALGITYPAFKDPRSYTVRSLKAMNSWKTLDPASRAGILMESLERFRGRFFEMAHATMHTTGQAFVMSFQASGPHAADRALEAIALGYHELTRFPQDNFEWVKPMGKFEIKMEKHYRQLPLGVSLCIGCSTFPVWNSLPGMYASLITGNPVLVKPHPTAIYPLAILVQELQQVLEEQGQDPHLVQLVVDRLAEPVAAHLAQSAEVKIIDFTGGNTFGDYLESLPGKVVFTEKAGVNSVIIDSVADIIPVAQNIAFSVSMYSGQMCTCPQDIFIPRSGIRTEAGHMPYEEVVNALVDAIRNIATNPQMGANVLGAIQSEATLKRLDLAREHGHRVLLEPATVTHPDFPDARFSGHLVLEVPAEDREMIGREWFGPIVLMVPVADTAHAAKLASELAASKGAISCLAYATDADTMDMIESEMADAAVSVSFNFTGMFWVNQNAGFSDFHVSGGNPAGNGSLTDPAFLVRRFVRVGSRVFRG